MMTSAQQNNKADDALENAEEIIECFGGIRPMASKMDVPVTTVQGWKKRNVIPANRRDEVIDAASENNIDLSGVIEKGIANENNFAGAVQEAIETETPESRSIHEQAVEAGGAPVENASRVMTGIGREELLKEIKIVESRAVKKSILISTSIVVLAVVGAAFLSAPSQKRIEQNGKAIASLQTTTENMDKEQKSFFANIIPENLQQDIESLRQQAESVRTSVVDISNQVQNAAADMANGDFSALSGRVAILEEQINELAGVSPGLTKLVERVESLQKSVEGQEQLAGSLSELQKIVSTLQGQSESEEDVLAATLAEAQDEEDALGQTLEGVPSSDLKAAAMLLALSQLRESFHRSAPFEEDLVLMQQLLGGQDKHPELYEAMNRLAPRASEGVLTPEGLQGEFKGLAGDIVVASLKGEDVSVQERAKARFNEILQVEKEGELITGTDTQATVARAQKMLDAGNVEGAIAELKTLEDPNASQAAESFVQEAEMTVLMEKLQAQLTDTVLGNIGVSQIGPYSSTKGINLKSMATSVKNTVTGGTVVRDDDSGFVILTPEKKFPGQP